MWGVSEVCYFGPSPPPPPPKYVQNVQMKIALTHHLSKTFKSLTTYQSTISKILMFYILCVSVTSNLFIKKTKTFRTFNHIWNYSNKLDFVLGLLVWEKPREREWSVCFRLCFPILFEKIRWNNKLKLSEEKNLIFFLVCWSGRNQERVKCLFPSVFSKMETQGERQCALCKTMKVKGTRNN